MTYPLRYSLSDQACLKFDRLLRMLSGNMAPEDKPRPVPVPADAVDADADAVLSPAEKKQVAGLMRVNYAGEVCAQALYQGQALTARDMNIKYQLQQAGLEEVDHLHWCQARIAELGSHVSYFNPLWHAGAFALGVVAGFCGDPWSLGFLAETEKQVVAHLDDHLEKLPMKDKKTFAILQQMRLEEAEHARLAEQQGAAQLPKPVQFAMKFTAKIMTTTAYWF